MLSRYVRAALSQGIVSIFHFALNIALVRQLEPAEYGFFAIVFAAGLITASASNALFTVPLSVLRPGESAPAQERLDRRLTTPAVMFGAVVAVCTSVTALMLAADRSATVALAAGGFVGTFGIRMHGRGAGYARFDAQAVLRADLAYVLVGASATFAVLSLGPDERSAGAILIVLSVANVVSMALMTSRSMIGSILTRSVISSYRPYWSHARWALVGAIATMLASQGHGLIISALKGAEAFAPIAAGFVLFGPVRILFSTIQNVLRPEMARSISEKSIGSAARQAYLASAATVTMVVGLSGFIAVLWGPIFEALYAEQYADEPMVRIVVFWAVVSLIGAARTGSNALLQAMTQFARLSYVGVAGASVAMTLVAVAALFASIPFTILAVAAGETVMTIGTFALISRLRTRSVDMQAR